jgi:hypothetical protein
MTATFLYCIAQGAIYSTQDLWYKEGKAPRQMLILLNRKHVYGSFKRILKEEWLDMFSSRLTARLATNLSGLYSLVGKDLHNLFHQIQGLEYVMMWLRSKHILLLEYLRCKSLCSQRCLEAHHWAPI